MFGNAANKTFGQATTFGATTTFGAPATSFGQTPATGFGLKQSAPVFGGFGATTTATPGNMFNSTAAPGTTGLFGQSTGFGVQPVATSASTYGFGQPTTATSLFGSTPTVQPNTSMSLFGTSTASAFGTPRPSFGTTFNPTATPSLFGQQQTQQAVTQPTTSLFGQTSVNTGGLFGSSGFNTVATSSGTVIKFSPMTGTDTMLKNGVSTNINTRHQCITCMKEYENKSLEELRSEDYTANRKGPQQTTVGFGAAPAGQGLFGAQPASTQSSFNFNPQQNKSLFGGTTTTSFGTATPSMFGQTNVAQPTSGLFTSKALTFGTTTTAPTTAFAFGGGAMGGGVTTTTTPFGQVAQQPKTLFGQPTATGLFGAPTATSQPSSVFGSTPAFGTSFGQTTTQPSFMGVKSAFGVTPATTASTFAFGNPTTTGAGIFGPKTTATSFPSTTGFSSFAAPQSTGLSMFNQPKPTLNFGTAPAFGTTGGIQNTFTGLGTFGQTLGQPTGSTLFGATQANMPKPGAFGFGATPAFPSFGAPAATQNMFGAQTNLMDPNSSLTAQSSQIQAQILALGRDPFGDSPLFRNFIRDTNKREDILRPTNPGVQKELMKNHKVDSLPSIKLKPKPIQSNGAMNGKGALFDGLEEEAAWLAQDVFVPRKSVKKLSIKPKVSIDTSISDALDYAACNGGNNATMTPTGLRFGETTRSDASHLLVDSVPKLMYAEDTSARNLSALENSISELKQRGSNKMFEVARSLSTEPNESDIENLENISEEPLLLPSSDANNNSNAAGVTLQRAGYYTIPPMDKLSDYLDSDGNCFVDDFTVGRENYGNVFFPGVTNLAGLNLDKIVNFRRKEVIVYAEDDETKPPIGQGLNKKAQVTLDKVFPVDKSTRHVITSPQKIVDIKFEEQLEKAAARLGASFIEYRPETGSWVFGVQHF